LAAMQRKLEFLYRVALVALVALLLWSVWASAQTNTVTNVPAGAAVTNALAPATSTNALAASSSATNHLQWVTFRLDRVELLQFRLLGIPLWQYLSSLIYIFLAFYLSRLADWVIRHQIKRLAARTKTNFDDLLVELLRGPIRVVSFVLLLHIGLSVYSWPEWLEVFLSKGLKIIVAISITYVLLKLVDLALGLWRQKTVSAEDKLFDDQLFPVIRKSLKLFIMIVATLVTAQNLDFNITALLASLSVGGLALGLAAQDTVANLFGAVSIFLDKPFRVGDRIQLDPGVDGAVETIGLRSTRVRNLDGHLVTIPNKTMGNAIITNIAARPNIKTMMEFGLTYSTPAERVRAAAKLLEEIYRAHPMTQDLIVSFHKFAESSLNILVVHWWNSTDYKQYLAGMQELNLEIKRRFDAEGFDFAFPSRTVYHKHETVPPAAAGEDES
jgi:MscS family membrane protein